MKYERKSSPPEGFFRTQNVPPTIVSAGPRLDNPCDRWNGRGRTILAKLLQGR
jgi:hypothetical protein